jgi:putative flippase GtrA
VRSGPYNQAVARASEVAPRLSALAQGAHLALRKPSNWIQLAKFCAVGATGYVVNLGVYTALVHGLSVNYLAAAVASFAVAVLNNYTWNRLWTFRSQRGHIGVQGIKFVSVSLLALAANVAALAILVRLGVPKVPAQAIAIVVVTPLSFLGNKLWSFRP